MKNMHKEGQHVMISQWITSEPLDVYSELLVPLLTKSESAYAPSLNFSINKGHQMIRENLDRQYQRAQEPRSLVEHSSIMLQTVFKI